MVRTFKTEPKYDLWFRQNLEQHGYIKALMEPHNPRYFKPFPDFWCVNPDMTVIRVELELFPTRFIAHKHDPNETDIILCAEDNRMFYPDFPKELDDMIVISDGTAAIRGDTKGITRFKHIVKDYIKDGDNTSLLKAMAWIDRKCCICDLPLYNTLPKAQKLHKQCIKEVLNIYNKNKSNPGLVKLLFKG